MKKFAKFIIIFSIFINSFVTPLFVGVTQYTNTTTVSIAYAENNAEHNAGGYLDCSSYDFACKGVNFLQMIFVAGGNVLVGISAIFMDFFLTHSIQSATYKDQGFIEQGWEIIRDMTNIVFIFALIIIAFNLVLGTGGSDGKRRLIKVILISLMINFSLFGVYVVIDTSNILAHVFYNKIEQKETIFESSTSGNNTVESGTTAQTLETDDVAGSSVSLEIAAKINPQKILKRTGENTTKGQRIVIILMIGVINFALIYTFLSVSFLFLGRTIGLWISAILAPLALASITIPGMDKLEYIGFGKWLSSFLKMAFMAPVFLFFLYLAVKFMAIDIVSKLDDTGEFIDTIMSVIVPMGAIVTLILASKKVADKMSGDFAGTLSGFIMKGVKGVAGVGLAVATGGAALAGRATIGRGAGAIMKSDRFKNFTAKNPWVGKRLYSGMDNLQKKSFDANKSWAGKIAGGAAGAAGLNLKQPSWAKVGGEGKGGFKKFEKEESKKAEDFKKWIEKGEDIKDIKKQKDQKDKNLSDKKEELNTVTSQRQNDESNIQIIESKLQEKETYQKANDIKEANQKKELSEIKENKGKNSQAIVDSKIEKKEAEIKETQRTGERFTIDVAAAQKEKNDTTSRIEKNKDKEKTLEGEITKLNGEVKNLGNAIENGRSATFVRNAQENSEQTGTGKAARSVGSTVATVGLTIALSTFLGPGAGIAAGGIIRGVKELTRSSKNKKFSFLSKRKNFAKDVNEADTGDKPLSKEDIEKIVKDNK